MNAESGADVHEAPTATVGGLARPWSRSVDVLNRMVASRVTTTVRILRGQVRSFDRNFPEWREHGGTCGAWADRAATLLVLALINGRCPCGRHVRTCLTRDGCRCCVAGHALREWTPDEVSLGVFVTDAVRGSADPHGGPDTANRVVRGDTFSRSMLRPVLDRAGLEPLFVADAEFRRCAACRQRFERPDGADVCTSCGTPDDEAVNRREVVRHVLLYPKAGGYRRVRRVLCRECGGFFATERVDQGVGCPLERCRAKRQMRCPTRACDRWREVDDLTSPCDGCGEVFGVRCPRCRTTRTAAEVVRDAGNCRCGLRLLDALRERRLSLCRTPEVWVR